MASNGLRRFHDLHEKGIRIFHGLLPWTQLDCWVFNTETPAWRRWYKGAVKRELNRIGGGVVIPVPIRFKHRYQLLSDKSLNRYDCYALDDYTPTRGYGTRPGSTGSSTVSNRGVRYWAASNPCD